MLTHTYMYKSKIIFFKRDFGVPPDSTMEDSRCFGTDFKMFSQLKFKKFSQNTKRLKIILFFG